ncbi:MAG: LIC12162 family protein [Desulfovibrio sp.]|nr:LIC12162 family protein [Desulfovibrio sp.]
MSAKELILAHLPDTCRPDEVILAGPWSFAGEEERFPDFASRFIFAPEPLKGPEAIRHAVSCCRGLTKKLLPDVAGTLCPWSHTLPECYWEVLLTPWLGQLTQQIIERWIRIRAMLEAFENDEITLRLLPKECSFSFADENDFTLRGALGLTFNHWLFSRLFEAAHLPRTWHVSYAEPVRERAAQKQDSFSLKKALHSLLLSLPFPPLKGVRPGQWLSFSLALSHKSHGPSRSVPIAREEDCSALQRLHLPEDMHLIIEKALPFSLTGLSHPRRIRQTRSPKIRCASIVAYENAVYRRQLALFRARGNRLFFVQHGGNYGQIQKACLTAMVEYSQHAFLSWGWTKQGDETVNAIPLPYPQLARIRNAWHGRERTLLVVGTEMPLFGYRLDSHPTPLEVVAYRNAKLRFFSALSKEVLARTLYRPYFTIPSSLEDGTWLCRQVPELTLCRGPLMPHVLGTGLLVLDHHGTSLLEAMAANVPTLLYWERAHWPLTEEFDSFLDQFSELGIFHETPEKAAEMADAVFPRAREWWQGEAIQRLRREFCSCYARICEEDESPLWRTCLRNL